MPRPIMVRDVIALNPVGDGSENIFGVEIEFENAGDFEHTHGWAVHEDGSLRNNGLEIVSEPVGMSRVTGHIMDAYEAMRRAEVECSSRCGVHIHVNMTDRSIDDFMRVCATYAAVEPLLFQYTGRAVSNFCIPWAATRGFMYKQARIMEGAIGQRNTRSMYQMFGAFPRYSALNLGAMRKWGTVEFRHAPTWGEPEPLLRWISGIDALLRYSENPGLCQSLEEAADNYTGFLESTGIPAIFGLTDLTESVQFAEYGSLSVADMFLPPEPPVASFDWNNPDWARRRGSISKRGVKPKSSRRVPPIRRVFEEVEDLPLHNEPGGE